MLTMLSVMPALMYKKVSLSFISKNYYYLLTSNIFFASLLHAVLAYIVARWGRRSERNPKVRKEINK